MKKRGDLTLTSEISRFSSSLILHLQPSQASICRCAPTLFFRWFLCLSELFAFKILKHQLVACYSQIEEFETRIKMLTTRTLIFLQTHTTLLLHVAPSARYQKRTMMKHKHEGWWKKIDCVIKRMLMVMVDGGKRGWVVGCRKISVTQVELKLTHICWKFRCLQNGYRKKIHRAKGRKRKKTFFICFYLFVFRLPVTFCEGCERKMRMFLLFFRIWWSLEMANGKISVTKVQMRSEPFSVQDYRSVFPLLNWYP